MNKAMNEKTSGQLDKLVTIDFTNDVDLLNRVTLCLFTSLSKKEVEVTDRFNDELEKYIGCGKCKVLITMLYSEWSIFFDILKRKNNPNCTEFAELIKFNLEIDDCTDCVINDMGDDMKEIDIYSICEKIMSNGKIEVFTPFTNKNGVVNTEKFGKSIVNGYTEKLLKDCRKIDVEKIDNGTDLNSRKIRALASYIKVMTEQGKFSNGCEFSTKKLVNMSIAWLNNKFTFNLKDKNDLKIIAQSLCYSFLKGYQLSGKMFVIITNNDGVDVVRLVDSISGFYSIATPKAKKELSKNEIIDNAQNELLEVADNEFDVADYDALIKNLIEKRNSLATSDVLFLGKKNK